MRNVVYKVSAMLLVLWYFWSVVGFDVHTCSGSGKTFIATVITGTSCEDIHPAQGKISCRCSHHGSCCPKSGGSSFGTRPCCTDDWQMIALTGVRGSDERDCCDVPSQEMHSLYFLDRHSEFSYSQADHFGLRAFSKPDIGDIAPQDFQRAYGVWRI